MSASTSKPTYLIRLLRQAGRLYPKAFWSEYGTEIISIAQTMYDSAPGAGRRLVMCGMLLCDILKGIAVERKRAIEATIGSSPMYIQRSLWLSVSFIAPYIMVCAYNTYMQMSVHMSAAVVYWEAQTWKIYALVLPALAGVIAVSACVRFARKLAVLRSQGEGTVEDASQQTNAILLAIPLGLVATVALL